MARRTSVLHSRPFFLHFVRRQLVQNCRQNIVRQMVQKLRDCSETCSTARTARNNDTLTALGDRWRLINECIEIVAANLLLQSSEQYGFLHSRTPEWCAEKREMILHDTTGGLHSITALLFSGAVGSH
jgi:hypothetical protein